MFRMKSYSEPRNIDEFNERYLDYKVALFQTLTYKNSGVTATEKHFTGRDWSIFCNQAIDYLLGEEIKLGDLADDEAKDIFKHIEKDIPKYAETLNENENIATAIASMLIFKGTYLPRFLGKDWTESKEAERVLGRIAKTPKPLLEQILSIQK